MVVITSSRLETELFINTILNHKEFTIRNKDTWKCLYFSKNKFDVDKFYLDKEGVKDIYFSTENGCLYTSLFLGDQYMLFKEFSDKYIKKHNRKKLTI